MKYHHLSLSFVLISCAITLCDAYGQIPDTPSDIAVILNAHNQNRAKHGAPPMQWDPNMASDAAAYAAKCQYQHSTLADRGGDAGENLAAFSGYPDNKVYQSSADGWYNEVQDYNYNNPGSVPFSKIGHFTQMVWVSSTKLGCGRANCPSSSSPLGGIDWTFVVCRYSPAGNVMDSGSDTYKYFKLNVLPPGSTTPSSPVPPSPIPIPLPSPTIPLPSPIPIIDSPSPSTQSPPITNSPSPDSIQGVKISISLPKTKKCTANVPKKISDALLSLITAPPSSNIVTQCTQSPAGVKATVFWNVQGDLNSLQSQINAVIKNAKLKSALKSKGLAAGSMSACMYPSQCVYGTPKG